MRVLAVVSLSALSLAACAPTSTSGPDDGGSVSAGELGNDCAVIAAVAKEHFRFGPDNPPPPIRFQDGYDPACDWNRHGLAFTPYDAASNDGRVRPWVKFDRPRYDGRGALITVGIMHGRLAGQGSECRLYSGFAGWTVGECRATWAS